MRKANVQLNDTCPSILQNLSFSEYNTSHLSFHITIPVLSGYISGPFLSTLPVLCTLVVLSTFPVHYLCDFGRMICKEIKRISKKIKRSIVSSI